ncbi:MAG: 1-(5-phosphoribosyl)-5-[(5-phosphoribosylamino)methylideneamino]imidazole-4-carboxamide isomerase [Sphingomonadaceae bacterium]|uniref:1-(5-phosphoribosyl)-5-[(5- phosphoribosylamino)methylideneamino]imidazole-4- carboxamide isomerase n=1 Tax=Thermaurantiacus sp. TaxID=2820283 RepID=UPI00298EDA53|nr:1-(5-phosphoribosyl)-5-[(5-phosphoribosylamino)methylideneamino]imidazole-4-carboxamide isomerase [Thermaurantiacus sp.]MCS6986568.1 1-(5-phosphoribosyl)-5-[(5-phosphoribosylamino)methylideneamino]imidazole-4-carboxamide isomerase [Sphingomonadaceae bacterium]MDW8414171.1 1-(5-phosphoribosyl)-5-[(5-phosphoribosylamino)methylideneamino]imidazole-4-carboxamide isomerase [Thermaurantiacus sp.]
MRSAFEIWPAIDLKAGRVVRLERGDPARASVYADGPALAMRRLAGCPRLHVVDLDGAFCGQPANAAAVEAILKASGASVQVGGGIRTRAAIEHWLGLGAARVVLGTVALEDPALVREAARAFPGRIVVAVDSRDGRVAVRGWADVSTTTALDLARRFEDAGVAALLYTDIARDGMLTGPALEATARLAEALSIPVLASGGVAGLADIRALKAAGTIAGVVVGRALWEGRFTLAEALEAAA